MTGLELLKQKMREMGATTQQCETKWLPMVLEILAREGNESAFDIMKQEMKKATKEAIDVEWKYRELVRKLPTTAEELTVKKKELEKAEKQIKEVRDQLEELRAQIMACETPEGRDKMRLLEAYKKTAYVENGYQKTAFNSGLAALFSGRCEP